MRIQKLSGGLANQTFQYIFLRYGEIHDPSKDIWYLDDSDYFINDIYNGYELKSVFGVTPNLLSEAFDKDVWDEIIRLKKEGYSVPQIIKDFGVDICMYAETDEYLENNGFDGEVYRMQPEGEFYPDIVELEFDNVYYDGNWIDSNWYKGIKDIIKDELTFSPIIPTQAQLYEKRIKETKSVALHIRRGNYVDMGLLLEPDYYFQALKHVAEKYEDFKVFVFSDDLYWCNQHANEIGLNFAPNIEYISGNVKSGSFVDLQLMSMCEVIIMANSAFSYLAGVLAPNLEAYIDPRKNEWVNKK